MIVRKGTPPEVAEADGAENAWRARRVSEAGGLTQFGLHVHTLAPGGRSSDRHWHEHEDELLFVLDGEVTVVEDDGEHTLAPGDAACWPAGEANAHHVRNRSGRPCSYLICGTRVPRDVVHYPELGRTLHIDDGRWRVVRDDDGVVLKEGTE